MKTWLTDIKIRYIMNLNERFSTSYPCPFRRGS
jgi:hypothetical protein